MHIDRRTMLAGTVAVAVAGAASGTRTVWAFDRNMTGATMTEQTNRFKQCWPIMRPGATTIWTGQ